MDLCAAMMVYSGMRDFIPFGILFDKFDNFLLRIKTPEISVEYAERILDKIEARLGERLDDLREIDFSALDPKTLAETIRGLIAFYLSMYGLTGDQLVLSYQVMQAHLLEKLPFLKKLIP